MVTLRRIIFYLFLLIYLIFCPLLILYAFGYIFKPDLKKFLSTGNIYLSSIPAGAVVYLNGGPLEDKTPALIDKLAPGEYDIRISLENYLAWHKMVRVEPEKTAIYGKVILTPYEWETKVILKDRFKNMESLGGHFLMLSKGPSPKDRYVYDYRALKLFLFNAEKFPYKKIKTEKNNLLWSAGKIGVMSPELEWIYSEGNDIRQAVWVHKASNILFRDDNRVFLLEHESSATGTARYLFSIMKGSSFSYDAELSVLYYLEPKTGKLVSTGIVNYGTEEWMHEI